MVEHTSCGINPVREAESISRKNKELICSLRRQESVIHYQRDNANSHLTRFPPGITYISLGILPVNENEPSQRCSSFVNWPLNIGLDCAIARKMSVPRRQRCGSEGDVHFSRYCTVEASKEIELRQVGKFATTAKQSNEYMR
jgi:hypothetical protein